MIEISENEMRNITSTLIDGLLIDGSHHKQYALERVLKMLVPEEFDECKESWEWESGIPF